MKRRSGRFGVRIASSMTLAAMFVFVGISAPPVGATEPDYRMLGTFMFEAGASEEFQFHADHLAIVICTGGGFTLELSWEVMDQTYLPPLMTRDVVFGLEVSSLTSPAVHDTKFVGWTSTPFEANSDALSGPLEASLPPSASAEPYTITLNGIRHDGGVLTVEFETSFDILAIPCEVGTLGDNCQLDAQPTLTSPMTQLGNGIATHHVAAMLYDTCGTVLATPFVPAAATVGFMTNPLSIELLHSECHQIASGGWRGTLVSSWNLADPQYIGWFPGGLFRSEIEFDIMDSTNLNTINWQSTLAADCELQKDLARIEDHADAIAWANLVLSSGPEWPVEGRLSAVRSPPDEFLIELGGSGKANLWMTLTLTTGTTMFASSSWAFESVWSFGDVGSCKTTARYCASGMVFDEGRSF